MAVKEAVYERVYSEDRRRGLDACVSPTILARAHRLGKEEEKDLGRKKKGTALGKKKKKRTGFGRNKKS